MDNVDAAFRIAKTKQEPSDEYKERVVNNAVESVLDALRLTKDMPEFAEFNDVERTREALNDPTVELATVDQWIVNLGELPECCLGHKVEELSNLGKTMLMTAIMCEGGGCNDHATHKFLRYFAEAIRTAIDTMSTELLPSVRN